MASLQRFRELIKERLAVAAEEVFTVVQQTVADYEEQYDRQRKLVDIALKPEIRLRRLELPQQHVCNEEDIPADQQLSSLDPKDPKPQIKKEQEEPCISLVGEQPILKEETEINNREDQTGEKTFTCKLCGKAFRLFIDLTGHIKRAHNDEQA